MLRLSQIELKPTRSQSVFLHSKEILRAIQTIQPKMCLRKTDLMFHKYTTSL